MPPSPLFTIRRVVNPSEAEIDRIVAALDESFAFCYFDHSMPSNRARSLGMLRAHITAALIEEGADAYVAESTKPSKDILGVATWFGPGAEFLATEEQRRTSWDQMVSNLDKSEQDWLDYFFTLYNQYTTEALGEGVKLKGYHLQALGVVPSHWRRGIGRALIEVGEEKAKAAKVCTCIETIGITAVTFYARVGYEVKPPRLSYTAQNPSVENVPVYVFVKHFD